MQIPGFDLGASPREVREPRGSTLIMSTTNGTRAIVTAAESCESVLLGSLLNLDAVVSAVRERGEDVTIVCAGWKGRLRGRRRLLRGAHHTRARRRAHGCDGRGRGDRGRFPRSIDGINARTYGPPGLEEDIAWVSQDNLLDVVPRFSRMVDGTAEIVA